MFAVIKSGGLQYRVAEDQVVKIGKVKGDVGEIIQLGEVMILGGDSPQVGLPMISGASVAAEVLDQGRDRKVIAFKKRRRKNSRRRRGHRQEFTLVRITEILADGKPPTKKARVKPERKVKPETEDGGEAAAKPAKASAAKKPAKAARKVTRKPAAKKPVAKKPAAKAKTAKK